MLLSDIWFVVTEYLGLMDLFNLSLYSKALYVIVHKNKRYKKDFKQLKCERSIL